VRRQDIVDPVARLLMSRRNIQCSFFSVGMTNTGFSKLLEFDIVQDFSQPLLQEMRYFAVQWLSCWTYCPIHCRRNTCIWEAL